ncbi:hypothetical protein FZO89_08030 [Luteimonas viscosa]|uniref:Uncharacterized protein n=1 Tax=Luteimonas viscosa TaxID=1132694 RepID=A0A5D4XQI6_9GAMM|nr:hypothetical protein [Luteimonas viscosa]TYT26213.1 hypothetical protein FZO89_08030 [Luteimonas viscosa]
MLRRTAMMLAIWLAVTTAAVAAPPELEAEQVNLDVAGGWLALGGSVQQRLAQSFEVVQTGYISHVMLPLSCQPKADVRVTLEKTAGGMPDGSVVAYEELPGYLFDSIPTPTVGMRMVEFTNPPLVGPGTYAVTLRVKGKYDCGVLPGPHGDPYPAAKAWFIASDNPPGWIELFDAGGTRDLAFQVFLRPL